LAHKLVTHVDPVSKYIWERVSATNKKAIKKWEDKVPGLKPRLVRVLNKIISERSPPKRRAFLGVKPSRERKEMLEKSSEAVDLAAQILFCKMSGG